LFTGKIKVKSKKKSKNRRTGGEGNPEGGAKMAGKINQDWILKTVRLANRW